MPLRTAMVLPKCPRQEECPLMWKVDCLNPLNDALNPSRTRGMHEVSCSQNEQLWNDRLWRKAAIPNIGCVRCGTCYEIEMISRF
jgi:hypothetical protein